MAKLLIENVEYELADGSSIASACREAGVSFDCNTGICGSCQIQVLEGHENLSGLTSEEEELGLDPLNRLACCCMIEHGIVRITF